MSDSEARVELGEDVAWIAAALVLVASLGGAIVLAEWPLWGVTLEDREDPRLVEPAENGTELWPYTPSAGVSTAGRGASRWCSTATPTTSTPR
jgi:hypothetical protein